jgi:hypothetical protein
VPEPIEENEQSYMCIRGIDFASFYEFIFDFGTVPTVWY